MSDDAEVTMMLPPIGLLPEEERYCKGNGRICTHLLDMDEIERRLNATECLSADEAESIALGLPDEYSMLLDYAKALRGES